MREVNNLRGGADHGFDVFLFDRFSFPESALKILYLFLRTKKPERVRNQRRAIRKREMFALTRSRVTSSR